MIWPDIIGGRPSRPTREDGLLLKVTWASTTKAGTDARGPRAIYNAKDTPVEDWLTTERAKVPAVMSRLFRRPLNLKNEKKNKG